MSLLSPDYILRVLLVFVRISGLLLAAPFFSQRSFPVRMRVLLAAVLAYSMTGLVTDEALPPQIGETLGFGLAVLTEAVTGLLLGFAAQFIFWAVQFAGEIMGFQMGLSLAQVYNPIEGQTSNPLGRFLSLIFLLVFVLLDGHHDLLRALGASFDVVPLAGANLAASGPLLLTWTGHFFATSVRLAAPFMITIFLIDVSLGIFARVVPQADLFSLSLPLKLLAGLSLFYFFVMHLVPLIPDMAAEIFDNLLMLIDALGSPA